MAKITYKTASSPDDPIYSGGFVISSPKSGQGPKQSSPPSTAGQGAQTSSTQPETLDLMNLPFDPATGAIKAHLAQMPEAERKEFLDGLSEADRALFSEDEE